MVEPIFHLVPGDPIATIAERIYNFTQKHRGGTVVVDINAFGAISAGEIMSLLTELALVDKFVDAKFYGTLEVRNANWPLTTALYAVYNGIILVHAQDARMVIL